jgi:hypothetical protein
MQDEIKTSLGTYKRAMETEDFVYFALYEESDENANVKMFRKDDGSLVSDNYFANQDFMSQLHDGNATWLSKECIENLGEALCRDYVVSRKAVIEWYASDNDDLKSIGNMVKQMMLESGRFKVGFDLQSILQYIPKRLAIGFEDSEDDIEDLSTVYFID